MLGAVAVLGGKSEGQDAISRCNDDRDDDVWCEGEAQNKEI